MSEFDRQVGGNHYELKIQPVTYCLENKLGYMESTAIKYLSRWQKKGGIQDLEKAVHYIQMLIEHVEENPEMYGYRKSGDTLISEKELKSRVHIGPTQFTVDFDKRYGEDV